MKKTLLLLFIAIAIIQNVNAQKTHEDSTEVINAARRNTFHFRLSNNNYKKFQTEHFLATSDYFKPNPRHTPSVLFNDSLYIKYFRLFAFNSVLDQRNFPSLHDLLPPNHTMPGFNKTVYTNGDQQAAQIDAQRFALTKPMIKRFKTEHFAPTSDYFKPVAANVSNPMLLNDSGYVQTFRFEAYNKSYHQRLHPVGHGLLITGIVTSVTALIVALLVSISRTGFY